MGINTDDLMDKTKNNKKHTLERKLGLMAILPMVLMGIVVMFVSYFISIYSTQREVERNLCNVAQSLDILYDSIYPGDYEVQKDEYGVYQLCKGGVNIMNTNGFVDAFKQQTDCDVTIFYKDVRMVTSIFETDGSRAVRTVAQPFVSDAVINQGKACFYNNVKICGEKYFGYYTPMVNSDGSIVGMFFAGKPTKQVEQESMRAILWMPILVVIFSVLGSLFGRIPARDITGAINKEKKFLNEIAKGNLNAKLDESIVHRSDELGDMARFTQSVQHFIKDMIERDMLTKLYTRRVGETKINYTQHQLIETGVPYCIGMGDIDFFKKFNDTYGHDCGDLVLREVARIFNENMIGKGFTIRWGGEEFLIVYEDANLEKAYEHLKTIRQKILDYQLEYKGELLSVTMTFGLTGGDERDINDIIKEADNLLYYGKQSGRNRIVTSMDMKNIETESEEIASEIDSIREK